MKKVVSLFIVFFSAQLLMAQPFAVGHMQATFNDPARSNRAVPTEIYYPAAVAGESVPCINDTFPLLVFGHGFVMTWSAYQNIWEKFVAEGYVIAFPTTEGNISPVHAEFGADLAFLISALQQESVSNSSSILYNRLGVRSALMGHSMGGGSAFLAAAGVNNATTLVTFAAANTNPSSINAATGISIPALVIAGQNDCVAPPAQHQLPMYDSLNSSCKAYVSINGGGHCYFAETNFNCSFGEGTCSPNPTITRQQQQDAAQDIALLWLDYYLKGKCSAFNAFNDSIQSSTRITGTFTCGHLSPLITLNGNFLQSTPALTYQWLLNGNPISGATSDTVQPYLSGNYSVVTTYAGSLCPDTSNIINWIPQNGTDIATLTLLSVFPVPADQTIHLRFTSGVNYPAVVTICDITGRTLVTSAVNVVTGENNVMLNVAELAEGHYLIQLSSGDHTILLQESVIVIHD